LNQDTEIASPERALYLNGYILKWIMPQNLSRIMRNSIISGFTLAFLMTMCLVSRAQATMQASDLQYLASDAWKGELMYKDPDSGEEILVPVEMTATTSNNRTFVFSYHFPDNPKVDNMVRFKVNGKYNKISSNKIISRKELDNGMVEVTTKRKGKDNRKKAMLFYIYTFGPNTFSLATEVEYLGQNKSRVLRSKFTFNR
jgi:hypothetical protein